MIVPLLCFALLCLVFYRQSKETEPSTRWRSAFLASSLGWALFLTAVTEILSVFQLLTAEWLLGSWAAACVATLPLLALQRPNHRLSLAGLRPNSAVQWLLLAGVGSIVVIVGVIALVAPPNTWDSMVYHMPRVVHWAKNATVAHYPTHVYRQLNMSPWAEFAILHLQLLSGGDRFANLVQWFSLLGSIVAASLIARQLGCGPRGQMISAVVCATIPNGILQASGTQNDYVVSYWRACFA